MLPPLRSAVNAHQGRLREHMAFHCGLQLRLRGLGFERQHGIEGIELEEIPVGPGRRTRATVVDLVGIIFAL